MGGRWISSSVFWAMFALIQQRPAEDSRRGDIGIVRLKPDAVRDLSLRIRVELDRRVLMEMTR